MINLEPLTDIINMDFSQLRALDGRATNESIELFVAKINEFFSELKKSNPPTVEDTKLINIALNQIIDKANTAEMNYYTIRNQKPEHAEYRDVDVSQYKIESLEKLPQRMQYWAAGERFGDTIRNAREHRKAVIHLRLWSSNEKEHKYPGLFLDRLDNKRQRLDFASDNERSPANNR